MKRTIASLLALTLVVGGCLMPSTDSQAAKIKLNKKKVTIKAGSKVKLKLKGTKKKVKWSSNKKSVASVSKKGVVKGKKAGKATITAKAGKKKYRCKVTVKKSNKTIGTAPSGTTTKPANTSGNSNVNSVSTDQLAANVDIKAQKVFSGILLTATNRNTVWLDGVKVNYSFCTASGTPVETDYIYFSDMKPGAVLQKKVWISNSELPTIEVSKTIVSKTVDYSANTVFTDRTSSVTVTSQKMTDGDISYTLKNNAGTDVYTLVNIYYYDAAGKLVDADYATTELKSNETKMDTISPECYIYDDDYNRVYQYATYKIVVTASSYIYNYNY